MEPVDMGEENLAGPVRPLNFSPICAIIMRIKKGLI